MNYLFLVLMAIIAGAAIATQASMNAHLGVLLQNTLLASLVAFASGLIVTLLSLVSINKGLPDYQTVAEVPYYLWYAGGLLSAFAITVFYWLIPKMGVAMVISCALSGQLLLAMLAGHFGWFNLPDSPLSTTKIVGALSLVLGMVLINF